MRLHHVQVSCPRGGEEVARRFYGEGLGLPEVEKPAELRARGGVWFRSSAPDGSVLVELHVGVEEGFAAAQKAHPAFVLADDADFDAVLARLVDLGFETDRREEDTLPGYRRVHTRDGHGNRVELLV